MDRDNVVIVATCRDGTVRVIPWSVAGDGPDNTWTRASALVDENLRVPSHLVVGVRERLDDVIEVRAARLETIETLAKPRPAPGA
jgi:hypothetical protein